jgi:hypothetical protein
VFQGKVFVAPDFCFLDGAGKRDFEFAIDHLSFFLSHMLKS